MVHISSSFATAELDEKILDVGGRAGDMWALNQNRSAVFLIYSQRVILKKFTLRTDNPAARKFDGRHGFR